MHRVPTYLLLVCGATMAYDLTFDYQIKEGNARFVEKIKTNLEKNIVQFHTPAHNNVLESYKIQDFKQGKEVTCLPGLHQCRLRDLDTETAINPGKITESFVHSWNQGVNSIASKDSKVVELFYYIDGNEIVDTVFLGPDLQDFLNSFGFPLYEEKMVPKDARVLNITHSAGNRVKRLAVNSLNCPNQQPVTLWGLGPISCTYIRNCGSPVRKNGVLVLPDCGNIHVFSHTTYRCSCCPWVTVIDTEDGNCQCNKILEDNPGRA